MGLPIETARLLLRPFVAEDLERVADLQSRPEVTRFLYWEPRSREEAGEWLAGRIGEAPVEEDDDVLSLAAARREDGLLLGGLTLWLRSARDRQVEVGYVFHPDAGGRGYATEATRALMGFAFAELGAHRVFARTDARNVASAALLRRLGMRQEAHFREAEVFKGEWGDELVFAILGREWRSGVEVGGGGDEQGPGEEGEEGRDGQDQCEVGLHQEGADDRPDE